jgi:two-component system sensor histidine kinase/response regulator
MGQYVRDLQQGLDETAVAKEQKITVKLPHERIMVRMDKGMMEVILGNLLDNAVKFTPQGGRIHIALEVKGKEVWYVMQDSGVGIPQDQLERIFRRFYQVEHPLRRRHEGMGLGLSIAKDLAELHNGRIWVESVLNQGSRFTIAFPLIPNP